MGVRMELHPTSLLGPLSRNVGSSLGEEVDRGQREGVGSAPRPVPLVTGRRDECRCPRSGRRLGVDTRTLTGSETGVPGVHSTNRRTWTRGVGRTGP